MKYPEINNIKIPEETADKWQNIVDIMAEIMKVPVGLIMKTDPPYIEVFKASQNKENSYQVGDREHLAGLYCEEVIKSGKKLLVADARKDKDWKDNPDLKLGMVSYLGFPLKWPDGKIFGTICVLDSKENKYNKKLEKMMSQYKELVESHLKIIYQNNERNIIYNNIEQGICLHEIIYKNDKPINYRIIDANPAFEKILNIPVQKADGSLATEIYNTDKAPYLDIYAEVADTGKTVTLEEYFAPMDKYFHITVTSPEKGKFITLFYDITENKKMEKKIRENEKRLSITLNSIGDGVIATDKAGYITEMNLVAERLTGWTINKARGKKLSEIFNIINSKNRKPVKNPVKKVLETGRILGLANHTILIARDGVEYQIADSASPIMDKEQNISGVVLVFRDVTEKYKKDQQIKESEKKYRTLVTRAPIGIFKTTSTGKVLSINQSMAEIMGCSIIKEALERYKELNRDLYVNPDRRKEFIDKLKKDGEVKNFEYRAKRADGNHIWLSMNARISDRFEDGSFIIASDITEQKNAKEKLKKEYSWLQSLFKNSSDPIVRVDKNHCVKDINQRFKEVFKYKLNEIKGKDLDHVIDQGKNNIADTEATKRLLQGKKVTLEDTRYDKNGNHVECLIKGVPVIVNNKFIGGYAVYIDITERKKAEKKMQYLSYHDGLTGLYNRTFLEEEIKRLDVKRQLPISIIMADLNGLKLINDSYGHLKGDRYLIKTAEILKESCRKEDIISRWGGDEFVLLLPQTDFKGAQKIRWRIDFLCSRNDDEIPISIAIGLDVKDNIDKDIYEVLKKAEEEMYQDKLAESRSAKSSILKALLNTLGAKSHETKEHAWRLQKIATQIGKEINLSHSELDRLSLVATLHDIGKIVVPENILTKPDMLTDEEWEIIKEHPATGYRITLSTEEFSHISKEILNHHERWDGTGYPEGAKGEGIPLLARIIAIADAYDVMTNGRPYKEAMSKEQALREIKRCAGNQFDPLLVKKFQEVIEKL